MNLDQFLNLVLSVETRHIGGAIFPGIKLKIPLSTISLN